MEICVETSSLATTHGSRCQRPFSRQSRPYSHSSCSFCYHDKPFCRPIGCLLSHCTSALLPFVLLLADRTPSRCLSIRGSKHEVNHLYWLSRHVIGLWFWLENSPGFGSKRVFPPVNHSGNSSSPTTAAWKLAAIPLCSDSALFHQKFTIRSGPGALQLRFFFMYQVQNPPVRGLGRVRRTHTEHRLAKWRQSWWQY